MDANLTKDIHSMVMEGYVRGSVGALKNLKSALSLVSEEGQLVPIEAIINIIDHAIDVCGSEGGEDE